jgi:hypothetical protein
MATGPRSTTPGTTSPSPLPSIRPAEVLGPIIASIQGQSLHFRLGSPTDREDGTYDAGSGLASLSQSQDGRRVQVITAPAELYLIGVAPDASILRVDVARLPDAHGLVPLADPLALIHLITGVTEVQRTPEGYAGKIDLTHVDPGPSPATQRMVARLLGAAAERATAAPFQIRLDEQGRLELFKATFPKAENGKDLEYEFTVLDVGGPVTVTRPTGPTVVEAPAGVYAP